MTPLPAPARLKPAAFVAIAAVHVALIACIGPLSPKTGAVPESTPIEVTLSTEREPPEEMPAIDLRLLAPALPSLEPPVVEIREESSRAIAVAAEESPPATRPPMRVVSVTDVAYLTPPRPRYPMESRRSGEQGLVVLRVLIDELGRAARVEIQRSSGYARLDAAARDAVEQAVFKPYLEDGIARTVLATIPIEFNWKRRDADESRRS